MSWLEVWLAEDRARDAAWRARMAAVRAGRPHRLTEQRVRELEQDVARLTLMVMTLTETVLRKGVMSRAELAVLSAEIDRLDGEADGQVDPAELRPEPPAPAAPAAPKLIRRRRRS